MFDIEAIITKNEEQVQEALAQSTNAFQRIKDEFGTKQDWWRNGEGLHTTKHRFRLFYSHVEEKMPKNHQESCSSIHSNLTEPVLTYTGETSSVDRQNRLNAFLNDRLAASLQPVHLEWVSTNQTLGWSATLGYHLRSRVCTNPSEGQHETAVGLHKSVITIDQEFVSVVFSEDRWHSHLKCK